MVDELEEAIFFASLNDKLGEGLSVGGDGGEIDGGDSSGGGRSGGGLGRVGWWWYNHCENDGRNEMEEISCVGVSKFN